MFGTLYKICRKIPMGGRVLRYLYGCEIPRKAKIGKNVTFAHQGLGVVIHPNAVIEDYVFIQYHVTIGLNHGNDGCPRIGKNVFIGAYAMILGPVNIGENAIIGAGALVMKDVPPNSVYLDRRNSIIKQR